MFNIKKFLPKKILGRLLFVFFVPLICIQILIVLLFYDRHWEKITTRFANIASNQINLIIYEYENGTDKAISLSRYLNVELSIESSDSFIKLSEISKSFVQKNITNTLKSRVNNSLKVSFSNEKIIIYVPVKNEILKLSFPKKYLVSETPIILFLWIISSSIILSIIAFLFLRIQVRAITRLAKFSEEFSIGKENKRFKPEGAIEIRMAGNAFIKMKNRIKNQINNRSDFLAGISHDLGTVLTRIKLQIELVTKISEIENIKQDVNSMQILLREYLDYSENDRNIDKIKKIKISNFAKKVISQTKKNFHGKKVELFCSPNIIIQQKENNLYRVFSNILNNACKFGDRVLIEILESRKNIQIKIEDNGPGIPSNAKKKIFKPFFKIDSSRNQNYLGSGLGLSIANEIMSGIGGRIEIEKSKIGGSCFIIIFPKY